MNVSYSKDIEPMLKANCYNCHTANAPSPGRKYLLDTYEGVVKEAKGFLYSNIADPDITSISHMPQGSVSLASCEILKVKAWINQGYKNN